jgi:cation transport regulator ChaB
MISEQEILTQAQRKVLPEAAQQLYVAVYTQKWQQYDEKRDGPMSREAVASISAMAAVTRQFDRDTKTLRWYRNGQRPIPTIDYKQTRIKQYHKEGRALRTETTINNPRDFDISKRLANLPALRQIGFQANRCLLAVERVSHDCALSETAFQHVNQPVVVARQRAWALRFGEPRGHALLSGVVLRVACLLPNGFTCHDLRSPLAARLGLDPAHLTPGRMTYELRRLRLHDLIRRIPGTYRYRLTEDGLRIALFFTRTYTRLLQPGLAQAMPSAAPGAPLRQCFVKLDREIESLILQAHLVA